jgi:hypothetical protein
MIQRPSSVATQGYASSDTPLTIIFARTSNTKPDIVDRTHCFSRLAARARFTASHRTLQRFQSR